MRFTFNQFVHYGEHHGGNIVNGMPWSFSFYGHPVTHETDDRYRICRVIDGKPADLIFERSDPYISVLDGGVLHIYSKD